MQIGIIHYFFFKYFKQQTYDEFHLNTKTKLLEALIKCLFVCVGVLRPSQQRGHVEPVS